MQSLCSLFQTFLFVYNKDGAAGCSTHHNWEFKGPGFTEKWQCLHGVAQIFLSILSDAVSGQFALNLGDLVMKISMQID